MSVRLVYHNGRNRRADDMISLLLVDYELSVDNGVRFSLSDLPGCNLIGRESSEADALASIGQRQPEVVVIAAGPAAIADALESARRILRESSAARVILMVADVTARQLVQALQAGVRGVVTVDAGLPGLEAAIRAVNAGASYLSQPAADTLVEEFFRRTGGGAGKARFDRLSKREREVLKRIADGQRTAGIAEALSVSPKTVDTYRRRAMAKLDVTTGPALVRAAIAYGVTSQ